MTQIGQFTRIRGLFSGRIKTLCLDAQIVLVPIAQKDAPQSPDYGLHLKEADGPEVGAGWKRSSERAGEFIAITLDDPIFPIPLRANLFQLDHDKRYWGLHWSRQVKPVEKETT